MERLAAEVRERRAAAPVPPPREAPCEALRVARPARELLYACELMMSTVLSASEKPDNVPRIITLPAVLRLGLDGRSADAA